MLRWDVWDLSAPSLPSFGRGGIRRPSCGYNLGFHFVVRGFLLRRALTFLLLLVSITAVAIERQPSSDYHARREALAKKANAAVLVFAGTEAAGQNDLYGFRQDNNFFYLTGWTEPGAAILINANPYTEILFLAEHNATQEKWTGPKLGPGDPTAAKETGFDKVESLDKMHDELLKILPQPRAIVYADLGDNGLTTASTGPV